MPPNLLPVRNLNLKVIFMVHFVFVAIICMGYWCSSSFEFYNFILILFLIWSIYHPQNEEPLQLAIAVNGISIVLDIFLLILSYPSNSQLARDKISAAFCILHLIVRPFSIIMLIKNLEERTGSTGTLSNLISGQQNPSNYEDIDRTAPQTSRSGGYDFETAQQI